MREDKNWQEIGQQFNDVISRIKHCQPLWADLLKKSQLFQDRMRLATTTYGDYLDAMQRVVDMAQWQEGGAKDLAPILTKMYVKQRNMESKLDKLTKLLGDSFNAPMKEKLKEWKETVDYLDTKHSKEAKKKNEDVKKAVTETEKLKKKVVKKGKNKKQGQLADSEKTKESVMYGLQQFEQSALRGALIEERAHYCTFVTLMTPAWEVECDAMDDGSHIRDVLTTAIQTAALPTKLPADAEKSIHRIRLVGAETLEDIPLAPSLQTESPRISFVSTNSSSTSGVSSGSSYSALPNSPLEVEKSHKFSTTQFSSADTTTQFSSADSLARSYPSSDQTSAYGSNPSVCLGTLGNTRGIVADITKFVELSNNIPNSTMITQCSPDNNRRSGDYSSLSPILNRPAEGETYENLDLHASTDKILSQEVIDVDQMEEEELEPLYENLETPDNISPPITAQCTGHMTSHSQSESPENIYDVPPQLPQRSSSFLCRRRSSPTSENSVIAYMERRRSTISQSRELLTEQYSPTSHYSRPPSICSNTSVGGYAVQVKRSESSKGNYASINTVTQTRNTEGGYAIQVKQNNGQNSVNNVYNSQNSVNNGQNSVNNGQNSVNNGQNSVNNGQNSVNNVYNGQNSVNYATTNGSSTQNSGDFNGVQSSPGGFNGSQASPSGVNGSQASSGGFNGVQTSSGGFNGVQNSSGGFNGSQNSSGGFNGVQTSSAGFNGVQNNSGGLNVSQNSSGGYNSSPTYAVQNKRTGSRLSLQNKGEQHPHYATMSARPATAHKRAYSLTSLTGHHTGSSPNLHNSTQSLSNRAQKVLSAVDPEMPPPPSDDNVGLELSELCQQITQGGTLRPSQMRMLGLKAGDSSTVRRNPKDKGNNFNTLCAMNATHHVHLNK